MSNIQLFVLNLAAWVGIWMVGAVFLSQVGGWAALAREYRCQEAFPETRWRFQQAQFRWCIGYNNCVNFGADPRGLYISVFPLFRVAHPPLFIPWRETSVSRRKSWWVKKVRFQLGRKLQIPVNIRERLAQKLQSAAGASWPTESDARTQSVPSIRR
jgi:hypothetical protein